jgi:uncharacterized protein YdeI (YjbR/CyaY-like superfamily)
MAKGNTRNPKVDALIAKAKKWQKEFVKLRTIVLDCGLTEELKWGVPCYSFEGHNVVLIHGFKEYCAILFVKGALLKDTKRVLVTQTENVQASRQVRFTDVGEIGKLEGVLKSYILEAVGNEKAGWKVEFKKTSEFKMPDEFKSKLDQNPALKTAFQALTPGRQRAYILYFSSAQQPKTRADRVGKCMKQILKGKGLND